MTMIHHQIDEAEPTVIVTVDWLRRTAAVAALPRRQHRRGQQPLDDAGRERALAEAGVR